MYSIFTKYSNYCTKYKKKEGYFLLELVIALVLFALFAQVLISLFTTSVAQYAIARQYLDATNYAITHLENWYSGIDTPNIPIDNQYHIAQHKKTTVQTECITITVSFTSHDSKTISLPFFGCKKR